MRKLRRQRGQTFLLFVLGIIVFCAFCAMVIDFGRQYVIRQKLRNYCDEAAFAGANLLPDIGNCAPVLEAMRVYARNILIAGETPPPFTCPAPTLTVVGTVTMKTYRFTFGQDTIDITTPFTNARIQALGANPNNIINVLSCRDVINHFGNLLGFPKTHMCLSGTARKGSGGPTLAPLAVPFNFPTNPTEWGDVLVDTGDPATSSINDLDYVAGHIYIMKGANFSRGPVGDNGFKGIVDLNEVFDQNGNLITAPTNGTGNDNRDMLTYIVGGPSNSQQIQTESNWRVETINGEQTGPVAGAIDDHNRAHGDLFSLFRFDDFQTRQGAPDSIRIRDLIVMEFFSHTAGDGWTDGRGRPANSGGYEFGKYVSTQQGGSSTSRNGSPGGSQLIE